MNKFVQSVQIFPSAVLINNWNFQSQASSSVDPFCTDFCCCLVVSPFLKKDDTILDKPTGIRPTTTGLKKVLELMKINTHVTPFCKYGLKQKFFSHPAITDSRYHGHQIAGPRVSALTAVDCNATRTRAYSARLGMQWQIIFNFWTICE